MCSWVLREPVEVVVWLISYNPLPLLFYCLCSTNFLRPWSVLGVLIQLVEGVFKGNGTGRVSLDCALSIKPCYHRELNLLTSTCSDGTLPTYDSKLRVSFQNKSLNCEALLWRRLFESVLQFLLGEKNPHQLMLWTGFHGPRSLEMPWHLFESDHEIDILRSTEVAAHWFHAQPSDF